MPLEKLVRALRCLPGRTQRIVVRSELSLGFLFCLRTGYRYEISLVRQGRLNRCCGWPQEALCSRPLAFGKTSDFCVAGRVYLLGSSSLAKRDTVQSQPSLANRRIRYRTCTKLTHV